MAVRRNSSARYQRVLRKTGDALAAVPSRLHDIKSSAAKYLTLESELNDIGRKFSNAQEDMSDAWFSSIADSLGHVGRSLTCLEKEKTFDNVDISLALELARHLDQISQSMINAADSFSLGLLGVRSVIPSALTTIVSKT